MCAGWADELGPRRNTGRSYHFENSTITRYLAVAFEASSVNGHSTRNRGEEEAHSSPGRLLSSFETVSVAGLVSFD